MCHNVIASYNFRRNKQNRLISLQNEYVTV